MKRLGLFLVIIGVWVALSIFASPFERYTSSNQPTEPRVLNRIEIYNENGFLEGYQTFKHAKINNAYEVVESEIQKLFQSHFEVVERIEYCFDQAGHKFREKRYQPNSLEPASVKNYSFSEYPSKTLEKTQVLLQKGNLENRQTGSTVYFKYFYNAYFEEIEKAQFNELGVKTLSERYYYNPPHFIYQTEVFELDENMVFQRTLSRRYHYDEYNRLAMIVTSNARNDVVKIVEFQYSPYNELISEISYNPLGKMIDFRGNFREHLFKEQERHFFYGTAALTTPPCGDLPPDEGSLPVPKPLVTTAVVQPTTSIKVEAPSASVTPVASSVPAVLPVATSSSVVSSSVASPSIEPITSSSTTSSSVPPAPTATSGAPIVEEGEKLDNVPKATSNLSYLNHVIYYAANDKTIYGYKDDLTEQAWDYYTNQIIISVPIVDANNVYYSNLMGDFFAIKKDKKEEAWKTKIKGTLSKNVVPYQDDQAIYFGTSTGKIYALKKSDGSELWPSIDAQGVIYNSPTYDEKTGLLLIGSEDKNLYAVKISDGTIAWKVTQKAKVRRTKAIVFNDRVASIDEDGEIMIVDTKDGGNAKTIAGESSDGNPVGAGKYMFYPTLNSSIICVDMEEASIKYEKQFDDGTRLDITNVNTFIVVSDSSSELKTFNIENPNEMYTLTAPGRVTYPIVLTDTHVILMTDQQQLILHPRK